MGNKEGGCSSHLMMFIESLRWQEKKVWFVGKCGWMVASILPSAGMAMGGIGGLSQQIL
jgi:hypothetical protein